MDVILLVWIIGIPLGMFLFNLQDNRDYKKWKQREKEYEKRLKGEDW